MPVGGLFIGLTCIYFVDFFVTIKADLPSFLGNLAERALGALHIAVGFWLMYLMFATVLNFTLKYTLPL